MYRPRHFAEDRPDVLTRLLRAAGFGHLVVGGPGGLESSPVPFLVDDDLTAVQAHLARPNPLWRRAPCAALLVVPVSDAYVSPGWYPSKVEHGRVVPTWNYEVVHLHGDLVVHDDVNWLLAHVRALTDTNEARLAAPWSVDDAPDGFVEQLARGIVGVELTIARVEGKRKLGQNRSDADCAGAVAAMRAGDPRSAAVADAMELG